MCSWELVEFHSCVMAYDRRTGPLALPSGKLYWENCVHLLHRFTVMVSGAWQWGVASSRMKKVVMSLGDSCGYNFFFKKWGVLMIKGAGVMERFCRGQKHFFLQEIWHRAPTSVFNSSQHWWQKKHLTKPSLCYWQLYLPSSLCIRQTKEMRLILWNIRGITCVVMQAQGYFMAGLHNTLFHHQHCNVPMCNIATLQEM